MTYELPAPTFNAIEAASNRIIRSNQFRDLIVQQYKAGYDAMWQTPLTHAESALTMEQMQSVLNAAQSTFLDVLTDSAAFVAFIAEAYPAALVSPDEDTEALLPERYLSAPYEYELGPTGLTLTRLKPVWQQPEEEPSEP